MAISLCTLNIFLVEKPDIQVSHRLEKSLKIEPALKCARKLF